MVVNFLDFIFASYTPDQKMEKLATWKHKQAQDHHNNKSPRKVSFLTKGLGREQLCQTKDFQSINILLQPHTTKYIYLCIYIYHIYRQVDISPYPQQQIQDKESKLPYLHSNSSSPNRVESEMTKQGVRSPLAPRVSMEVMQEASTSTLILVLMSGESACPSPPLSLFLSNE